MTERKPPDASVDNWIEFQIRRAQERGEFDGLRGHGKPIADLHEPHDELWWVKRKLRDEHVSVAPPAIQLRRDAEKLRERLAVTPTEARVRELVEAFNERILQINRTTTTGPSTSMVPWDVDQVVAHWRAQRDARSQDPPGSPD